MLHSTKELLTSMTEPSPALIQAVGQLKGDLMVLGAGGKIGPAMAIKAKRALQAAGSNARVYAVSLFDYSDAPETMRQAGVEVIEADLSDAGRLAELPEAENIIYMVGKKFGTAGNEGDTWHTNVIIPYLVAQRFPNARIVSFSTGNTYGMAPLSSGGFCETDTPHPIGEYAQTCLGRERVLERCSLQNNTPMLLFRLNYSIDMRYGVLYDIARAIQDGKPVDVSQSVFNCVWQGEVCEYAIRALALANVPPEKLNVSSPEAFSIRWAAHELGRRLGKEPTFTGEEGGASLFLNCQKMVRLLGRPQVGILEMMDMVADWIKNGGETIDAPTHFETTNGVF